jgi:hypothetical protein
MHLTSNSAVFHLQCIDGDWNFHSSLTLAIVAPVVFGFSLLLFVAISSFVLSAQKFRQMKKNAVKWFLIFLYCVYPIVSNYVISTFNCEVFDDGTANKIELLRADFSIDCSSDIHNNYKRIAYFGIVLYPIGVPCGMLLALWPHRKELSDVASRKSQYAKSRHLSFFSADYKGTALGILSRVVFSQFPRTFCSLAGEYWYWEVSGCFVTGCCLVCLIVIVCVSRSWSWFSVLQ